VSGAVKDARGVEVQPGDSIVYATGGNWSRRGTATITRTAGTTRIYFETPKFRGFAREDYVRADCAYVVTLPEVPA